MADDRLYFRQLLSGRDFATSDPIARQMVNFVYLVGDRETGEALVIDPAYGVPAVFFSTPPLLNTIMALPLPMLAAALTMPVFTLLAWRNQWWRPRSRLHYTLLTTLALAITWSLHYWNFLL